MTKFFCSPTMPSLSRQQRILNFQVIRLSRFSQQRGSVSFQMFRPIMCVLSLQRQKRRKHSAAVSWNTFSGIVSRFWAYVLIIKKYEKRQLYKIIVMLTKRRQFIDRLLKISQLNEELLELADKGKQPAFTKRIKLIQMGKPQFNLPSHMPTQSVPRHGCKVLIIDKQNNRYHSEQHHRSKTSQIEKVNQENRQGSPQKIETTRTRILFEKRRSSEQIINEGESPVKINFVTPMQSESRSTVIKNPEECIPRRPKSQYQHRNSKQYCSSVKKISYNQSDFPEAVTPKVRTNNLLSGKTIKFNKIPTMTSEPDKRLEDRKAKIQRMRQINKNYATPFVPPPKISAKSYIVCEVMPDKQLRPISCYNSKTSQEVASLTKIMTCVVTIELCERLNINIDREEVTIGKFESGIGGTTAELRQGQIYTVRQLLYGLMLPSGNDASLALAVWAGKKLIQTTSICEELFLKGVIISIDPCSPKKLTKGICYARFLKQMNDKGRQLNLTKTKYANSHGLSNSSNRSSAYDIAVLSLYAMQKELFREVVSCRVYETTIKYKTGKSTYQSQVFNEESYKQGSDIDQSCDPESPLRQYSSSCKSMTAMGSKFIQIRWQNTHKLLHNKPNEYIGIKTGITTTAGPCLSSMVTADNRHFIIVVLACSKIGLRFKETQILKKWMFKHEGINKKIKKMTSLKYEKQTEEGCSQSDEDWSRND